jgi:hypothetical protein
VVHSSGVFGAISAVHDCLLVAPGHGAGRVVAIDGRDFTIRWTVPPLAGPQHAASRGLCATGIAISPTFTIAVADALGRRVVFLSPFGPSLGTLQDENARDAGAGSLPVAPDRRGTVGEPVAVCFDSRGSLFVASAGGPRVHAVQKFARSGRFLGSLRSFGVSGETFASPRGLLQAGDSLYVADTGHGAVQVFQRDGSFSLVFSTASRHGVRSTPVSLAIGARSELYVLDAGDCAELNSFTLGGEFRETLLGVDDLEAPVGAATSSSGRIFVLDLDGERLRAFDGGGRCLADLSGVLEDASVVTGDDASYGLTREKKANDSP